MGAAAAYEVSFDDPVRTRFESGFFARALRTLLGEVGGRRMLDLGCGRGEARALAGPLVGDYVGVDFRPGGAPPESFVLHDLRDGLGPVGTEPFDLYFGGFGVGSHFAPAELARLLAEIAGHARRGSFVAIEFLGLYSLEWPRLWATGPGRDRVLSYQLASEVSVHPWSPAELSAVFTDAGLQLIRCCDRTVQAGPKTGTNAYWPGVPALRAGLAKLLDGQGGGAGPLASALPPLPGHRAASVHHALARARAELVSGWTGSPARLAEAVWALEPAGGGGYGHGLLAIGRLG